MSTDEKNGRGLEGPNLGERMLDMLGLALEERLARHHEDIQRLEERIETIDAQRASRGAANGPSDLAGDPLLLNSEEASAALRISPRKLWELTNSGEVPSIRIGRALRYPLADLKAWIEAKKKRRA